MIRAIMCVVGTILLLSLKPSAQVQFYPETLWVPVTYYDFHSDVSNPEFQCDPYNSGVWRGMVLDTLDRDRKPIATSIISNIQHNAYVKYWYRDWNTVVKGKDYTRPVYFSEQPYYRGTVETVSHDTSFKNIVIQDSLPFRYVAGTPGVYQYVNSSFFPLDSRGFGKEGRAHNYSFSMELHWTFTKQPGLTFRFTGDDDVWAFVNNRLVMDIGGIHGASSDQFRVDDIAGLENGYEYAFDFFFAERHTGSSNIQITTNIISANPAGLKLSAYPSSTICAGDTARLSGTVVDEFGKVMQNLADSITWNIIPPSFNTNRTLSALKGKQILFFPTEAYDSTKIVGTLTHKGVTLRDTLIVVVTACYPAALFIEAAYPRSGNALRDSQPLSVLNIPSSDTVASAYAVLRDKYGNFVTASKVTTWSITDTGSTNGSRVLKFVAGSNADSGKGTVHKAGPSGSGEIMAVDNPTGFNDRVRVTVDNASYSTLRIVVTATGGYTPITQLTIDVGKDTLLVVQGLRTDGLGWENVNGSWSMSAPLKASISPPTSSESWLFNPSDTGTGVIQVAYAAVSTTLNVKVNPGGPASLILFPTVTSATPYVDPPEVISGNKAGSNITLFARVFSETGIRLTAFDVASAPISWSVTEISGYPPFPTGTLIGTGGNSNVLHPTTAYNVVQVKASLSSNGRVFSDSVRFYIVPADPHHLTIQNDTASIIGWLDVSNFNFGAGDLSHLFYPVVRDAFNNFISMAELAQWSSLDTTIVTAEATVKALLGEGFVTRVEDSASMTYVYAKSAFVPQLKDSVKITISTTTYDSLRIVVDGSIRIEYLKMTSDQDTLLTVQGLRTFDKAWVTLPSDWKYSSSNINMTQQSQPTWLFAPGDTSLGLIVVTNGSAVPDTVRVEIIPGAPAKLALYPGRGVPSSTNTAYANPPETVRAVAGKPLPLVSKIFDRKNVWLKAYESLPLSNQISWTLIEMAGNSSSGTLSAAIGDSVSFFPIRAYQRVYAVGSLTVNSIRYADTVEISIVPGVASKLFIEASSNWQASKNDPNPIDTITILGNMATAYAYAILRDSLGNFVQYSQSTLWGSLDTLTATLRNGTTALGEGIVSRQDSGVVKIHATDNPTSLNDSSVVKIVQYYFTELKIFVENVDTDSLVMKTTSDTTLRVKGRRSDNDEWEFVTNAIWENTPSLRMTPSASVGSMWRFSPTDTGTGFIRVTLNNDSITKPDTLQVRFIPGPPSEIRIKIITPEQQRIAGKHINMVIELYNEDGLVKGPYDFNSVKYNDILPDGARRPRPFVLLNADTLYLDSLGKQHFENGIDTIPLVLFYAPWNYQDSLHRISVTMDQLTASTELFRLYPGDLDKLSLEKDARWVSPIGDTLIFKATDQPILITSIGYDKYENRRGPESSNWSTDSTLHTIPGVTTNVINIYYDGINVEVNENGRIIAVPSDTAHKNISTSVFVRIIAPSVKLRSATTGDFNGNGYLDHITFKFNHPVTLPVGYQPEFKIAHKNIIFSFDGDSIMLDSSRTDSVWVIALREETGNDSALQTDWKPVVNFDRDDALGLDSILNHHCCDGAGPVIASATREVIVPTKREEDVITVVFSERIQRFDNIPLPVTEKPIALLYVWEKDSSGAFRRLDSILVGIENLTSGSSGNQLSIKFKTTNGINLTEAYYFSIKTIIKANGDTTSRIIDIITNSDPNPTNEPNVNNRKVRIRTIGTPKPEIIMYPNPATASEGLVPAGEFLIRHDDRAKRFVQNNGGGVVFSTTMVIPGPNENVKVRCYFKIYDIVGNLVVSGENPDITQSINVRGGVAEINIYWNGFKKNKMRAAAGLYKAIEYFEYYGSSAANKYTDTRVTGILGLTHGTK